MIERLYEVFASPRPAVVDFCDHCVDPADVAPFTSVPLRELTSAHLERYWLRSGTIGNAAFARYLLPRVLDLIAAGELEADFFWLRLATEAHAGGDQRERAAVEDYLLATPPALAALVDEVTTAKRADDDLAAWLRGSDPLAALEDAALTGPDADGTLSAAHLALESWR